MLRLNFSFLCTWVGWKGIWHLTYWVLKIILVFSSFLLCVYESFTCMYACVPAACLLDPLKLGLQMVVRHYVGVMKWTWVLCLMQSLRLIPGPKVLWKKYFIYIIIYIFHIYNYLYFIYIYIYKIYNYIYLSEMPKHNLCL